MKRNNLLGRKFSRLTVIAEAEPRVYESRKKNQMEMPLWWNTGMIFNEEERDKIKGSTYKPVRCVETNTIFKSVSFAGRQLALSQSNISRSCKTGCVCGGFHWEYV